MKSTKKIINFDDAECRISCGFYHCLAIKKDEKISKDGFSLYGWGLNEKNVLGIPIHNEPNDRIYRTPVRIQLEKEKKQYVPLQVSCGKSHSMVLAYNRKDDNNRKAGEDGDVENVVFCFGDSKNGKLGIETEENLYYEDKKNEPSNKQFSMKKIQSTNQSMFIVESIVNFRSSNNGVPIKMIACGSTFTLALDMLGDVYSWGEGSSGSLGHGMYSDEWLPAKIYFSQTKSKIKHISAGFFHAAAITIDGNIFTWGVGMEGQLGHQNNLNLNSPKMIEFLLDSELAFASCGMFHSACINEKGFLYTWGGNKNGQLGHGDFIDRNKPEIVKYFKNFCVSYVNCGANTTFVITDDDKVFSFGSNLNQKLAILNTDETESINTNTINTPSISVLSSNFLLENKSENRGLSKIYQIVTSNQFCLALSNKGEVFTWGKDNNGCLALSDVEIEKNVILKSQPTPIPGFEGKPCKKDKSADISISTNFVDIKSGLFHSAALTNAGELYIWGSNQYSQHGISSNTMKDYINIQKEKIKFSLDYFNKELIPTLVPEFNISENRKVTQVSCGYEYIFVIQNHKALYSWGRNSHGQCGIGTVCNSVEEPTLISMFDSHILKEVACGENHTLILDDKGDLYACGCSYSGKLGLGFMSTMQTTPKIISTLKNVTHVCCGANHSLALAEEIELIGGPKSVCYSWGSGFNGELGHGNKENLYVPKMIETKYNFSNIACGTHHSGGITTDFKVVVWGPFKYLGIQRQTELIEDDNGKVIDPKTYSEYLFPSYHPNLLLFESTKFVSLHLADKYSIAMSNTKELYYWGHFDINYRKELKKSEDAKINSDEIMERLIKAPMPMQLADTKFDIISVSHNHALGISRGKVYSWGIDANTGRLGLGYEYFDDEIEENMRKYKNMKDYVGIKDYNTELATPIYINYLNVYLERKSKEQKKNLNSAPIVVGSVNVLGTYNEIPKNSASKAINPISSSKNFDSIYQFNDISPKKKSFRDNNSSLVRNKSALSASKFPFDRSSRNSSRSEIGMDNYENMDKKHKFDIYENSKPENQKESLLNNENTETLFNYNKMLYSEIQNKYFELLEKIKLKKLLKKRLTGIILKRISSSPFEAQFLTKREKILKKVKYEVFFNNKKKFEAIFTILQIHPCYFLNIYISNKLDPESFFDLVKETFGEIENDERKIRLFTNLTLLILKYDLDQIDHSNASSFQLDLTCDLNAKHFLIFSKMFVYLFSVFFHNQKWLKTCLKIIKTKLRAEIIDSNENTTNSYKKFAIVITDDNEGDKNITNESDKKRIFDQRVKRLVSIMKSIFSEILKQTKDKGIGINESFKLFILQAKDMFQKYSNILHNLTNDIVQLKFLNLAFQPLYDLMIELENKGNENEKNDEESIKIMKPNYASYRKALWYFLQGKPMIGGEFQNKYWLEEINTYINNTDGDLIRKELYKNLFFLEEDIRNINVELDNQNMLKDIYKHSVNCKKEIITISLNKLIMIANLINNSLSEFQVIQPLSQEILYNINIKLKQDINLLNEFSSEDRKTKFNLKLKTKQLLRVNKETNIKQCLRCKCYLVEHFLKSEDVNVIEHFPILNPESIESIFYQIISILPKTTYESFFNGKMETDEIFDNYIKEKKDLSYENIQLIKQFKRQLHEHTFLRMNKNHKHQSEKIKDSIQVDSVSKLTIMKELKKTLEERAHQADTYKKFNDNLNSVMQNIKLNLYPTENNKWKKYFSSDFHNKSLKLCFYGLSNREFEKPLLNNPMALSGKIGGSIRSTFMSNDLYENMQYLLDEKGQNFSLFGCYSHNLLKKKDILESFDDNILYSLEFIKVQIKEKKFISKFKDNIYYIFNDNKQQGLQILLCYRELKFKFSNWACSKGKSNKNFEIIIEKSELSEEKLLVIRKTERELKEKKIDSKQKSKSLVDVGKYSKFYLSPFVEFINKLQNHYMIYDETFIKKP